MVIYAENRSFDNLYGLVPGANGIITKSDGTPANAKDFIQVDRDGVTPLKTLPPVWSDLPFAAHSHSISVGRWVGTLM